jgi:hypothetical protein
MASKKKSKARAKAAPRKKPKPQHPEVWKNMTVSLHFGWEGGEKLFKPVKNPPARLKLIPFEARDAKGKKVTRLRVRVVKESLDPNWNEVIFDIVGTEQVAAICPLLGDFKDSDDGKDDYIKGLEPISRKLQDARTRLQRIEGVYTLFTHSENSVERIPITFKAAFVPKCVGTDDGRLTDLVVFYADIPGGPQPDGGGTGPPTIDG